MKLNKFFGVSFLLLCISITGCTSKPDQQAQQATSNTLANGDDIVLEEELASDEETEKGANDPFEPFNRVVWDFNYEVLDRFLLKPLAQGYVAITPQPVRTGLLNAANNLEEPANTVNNLLQGKVKESATSAGRFAVNSFAGLLGIFDVASSIGLEREREDFGQVLGVWGVGTGPYLMLPALGPSDFRSFTGRVVDNYYWPSTVLEDPYVVGAAVIGLLETRAALLEQEENLNRALDQYLFVRDAYFQRLAFEVSDGEIKQKSEEEIEQEQDDFADFESLLEGTE